MLYEDKIWVGTGTDPAFLLPDMANRHGLIAGATGTGKTVTLKVLAEGFALMGVPVFMSDVKGDLAGMVKPGEDNDAIDKRLEKVKVEKENFAFQPFDSVFWDVYGEKGHPIRTTIREMGPLLLSRMLSLNDTQSGVLNILFRVSDDEGYPLIDIKDLKAMLAYVGENSKNYQLHYGNVAPASIGAIQRAVAILEDQGGDIFFGEPALDITDWIRTDAKGNGIINILAAEKLFNMPTMYSTFLLWMLTELYQLLPEEGDLKKPKMVFFFDEAHLLFNDCPKALMDKIEQVIRLIRSKAVGVYFITQNPADVPMNVLSQLGNRVQHALRAYTPLDQRGVKAAADTFRANPDFDTSSVITQLKTGEALVSFLDEGGAPTIVQRALILPPQSFMGAIDNALRQQCIEKSPMYGKYDTRIERQSAYEMFNPGAAQPQSMGMPVMQGMPVIPGAYVPQGVPVMQMPAPPVFNMPNMTAGQNDVKEMEPMTNIPNNDNTPPVFTPSASTPNVPQMQAPVQPVIQQPVMQQPVVQQPVVQQPVMQQPVVQQPVMQQPVMQQPVAAQQPQLVQMPTMVQDPATGAYVQQMVTMQFNPATGQYTPYMAQQQAQQPAEMTKDQLNAQKAQLAADKAADQAARRAQMDDLREERADRARFNDSIVGRMKNSAISSATRTVTNTVIRDIMNALTGKKK